jgi:hypothetical protein
VGPTLGRAASPMGRSAHASSWCLLEPSRVVFRSFHGLNHLLSLNCLFGVYDSSPRVVFWINPPTYKYSPTYVW